jgi:hypothetical protein
VSDGVAKSNPAVANATKPSARSQTGYHVISSENRWSVLKSGAQRAARVFVNQPEAVAYAVKVAAPAAVEVVVHRKDGSVARRISPAAKPSAR